MERDYLFIMISKASIWLSGKVSYCIYLLVFTLFENCTK